MKNWYTAKVSPMRENKSKNMLLDMIANSKMQDLFGRVLIPTCKEVKSNSKNVTKKLFPGYIFIEMNPVPEALNLVKSVKHVKEILSHGVHEKIPTCLTSSEVENIIRLSNSNFSANKSIFKPGQSVRVIKGFLANLSGIIERVNHKKSTCKVSVSILGRNLSFDVDFPNMILEE